MKQSRDEILKWFDTLIEKGEATLASCNTSLTGDPIPRSDDYVAFRTQALNLIQRVCGENSSHHRELHRLATESESANHSAFFPHCLGVVSAARADVELGLLTDLRDTVTAAVILEVLDGARRRRTAGHEGAAAVLAGAAIELALGALCEAHGVDCAGDTNSRERNERLAAANVYSAAVKQRVEGLCDVSDRAADPGTPEPKPADVEDLLDWTLKFVADYLS